jgi:hypothetical protein
MVRTRRSRENVVNSDESTDQSNEILTPDLVHDDTSREASDTEGDDPMPVLTQTTGSPSRLRSFRLLVPKILLILLELSVVAFCGLYLTARAFHRFHDEYMLPHMQQMLWTEERQQQEITYYNRYCYADDITASSVDELIIQPNTTAEDCMNHMLKHGVSVYPQVLREETADRLRQYISDRSNRRERFNVIENELRYSYSLEVHQDPIVVQAMKEIATHPLVRPALEKIIGPNPAVVEFSDITSTFGSEEQRWHQDIVPLGSAFKYARSFIPSYSLFIPLQDTTAEMGATQICPGTHMCGPENEHCVNGGAFHVSGDTNRWRKGDAAMMNQHLHHRGPAHVDPNATDRVLFVLTLAPRPRFGKMELETRILGQGAAYSNNWNNWGHTLDDFANAPDVMRQPWKTLRALGIYRPPNALWGWDFMTTILGRMVNEEYYFTRENLEDFLKMGGFKYLPEFLHDDLGEEDSFYDWLCGTFDLTERFLKKASVSVIGAYSIGTLLLLPMLGTGRFSKAFRSFKRIGFPLAFMYCILFISLLALKHTRWAKEIENGKVFHLGGTNVSVADHEPETLPHLQDVLIETRYNSDYLGSYNHILDVAHPGNKNFREMVRQHSNEYMGLSQPLKDQLASAMVNWVGQASGRLLAQKENGAWKVLSPKAGKKACHKALLEASSPEMNLILTEISYLLSETKYGALRGTALHRDHIPKLLNRIEHDILYPQIVVDQSGLMSSDEALSSLKFHLDGFLEEMKDGGLTSMAPEFLLVKSLIRKIRERLVSQRLNEAVQARKGLAQKLLFVPQSSLRPFPERSIPREVMFRDTNGLPPVQPAQEPYQGAWVSVGDIVEAKLEGMFNGKLRA